MEKKSKIYEEWIDWYSAQPSLSNEFTSKEFKRLFESLKMHWGHPGEFTNNEAIEVLEETKKAYLACLEKSGIAINS